MTGNSQAVESTQVPTSGWRDEENTTELSSAERIELCHFQGNGQNWNYRWSCEVKWDSERHVSAHMYNVVGQGDKK